MCPEVLLDKCNQVQDTLFGLTQRHVSDTPETEPCQEFWAFGAPESTTLFRFLYSSSPLLLSFRLRMFSPLFPLKFSTNFIFQFLKFKTYHCVPLITNYLLSVYAFQALLWEITKPPSNFQRKTPWVWEAGRAALTYCTRVVHLFLLFSTGVFHLLRRGLPPFSHHMKSKLRHCSALWSSVLHRPLSSTSP